jgi:dsDNA-binding SOS-regulon protein
MNLSDIRFPRQLEADDTAEAIRQALMARTVKLWPGGDLYVSMITMSDPLKKVLQKARLKGQIRCGFEAIFDKLENERKGITNVRKRKGAPYGDRVSRLLLFSNDGAQRFYRHIEHLLQAHAPRLLGCLLDIDGSALGNLITGKDRRIKLVMAEHKEVVSEILHTIQPLLQS